jgi:cobalt-zinc-cadmium efflux system protein
MNHDHHLHIHQDNKISKNKLLVTIILNICITISEIIGGLISGSLALLSDAFHNLSDVFSLIISYIALLISRKKKDEIKTFGYKRAEILAALLNIVILLIAIFYILQEAIKRIFEPNYISAPIMIVVTIIGLLGNLFSVFLIFKDSKKNINIKSAFLHLFADTISSFGVLFVALILMFFKNLYILDSIISILIAIFIVKEGISIFMESINILMQGIPKGFNTDKIIKRLKSEKSLEIKDIHHVHIWGLSSDSIILDCHVVLPEKNLKNINVILNKINEILECDFHISHATIQIESEGFDHSKKCLV